MKAEDIQNPQQGTRSAENKGQSRNDQKDQTGNVSNTQQNGMAGLGRDRMTAIEDSGGRSGDYAGSDNDDLNNEDLNASNDQ